MEKNREREREIKRFGREYTMTWGETDIETIKQWLTLKQ